MRQNKGVWNTHAFGFVTFKTSKLLLEYVMDTKRFFFYVWTKQTSQLDEKSKCHTNAMNVRTPSHLDDKITDKTQKKNQISMKNHLFE